MVLDRTTLEGLGFRIFGTKLPTPQEVEKADRLLEGAPTGSPLEVARYFESLEERNSDGELFRSEWKIRSNPLIVTFFTQATNYGAPATDQTKWCAAFVSWCLMRAGKPYPRSASSGDFRCFGLAVTDPVPG